MIDATHKYPIEKDIPVPKRDANSKYGFSRLEVGDSIFVPDSDITIRKYPVGKTYHRTINVQTAASYYASRKHIRLVTRKVEGGIRIWRIE